VSKLVPVIGPDRKVWRMVERDIAREMVANNEATWWNSCREVRLIAPSHRGASCNPSQALIERALDGSLVARIACESWKSEVHPGEVLKANRKQLLVGQPKLLPN
jgi:hypothetical protein